MTEPSRTAGLQRLPFLDTIRGTAILSVFLFHSLGFAFGIDQLPWDGLFRSLSVSRTFFLFLPLSFGHLGVAVFFSLSGFCIHLSHSKSKNWVDYCSRRFFRIYPPYLLALIFFFVCPPWGSFALPYGEQLNQLLSHILAIHNLSDSTFFGINASFWSIAVEIQLYAVYPILLVIARHWGWNVALMIVGAIEFVIRAGGFVLPIIGEKTLPTWVWASPLGYWWSWSIGAYLAEVIQTGGRTRLFSIPAKPLGCACVGFSFFAPTAGFCFPLAALTTATVILHLWNSRNVQILHGETSPSLSAGLNKHLSGLGVISYSFYLIHQPLIWLMNIDGMPTAETTHLHPILRLAACMIIYPAIFGISKLLYRWVETPSIAVGRYIHFRTGAKTINTVKHPLQNNP